MSALVNPFALIPPTPPSTAYTSWNPSDRTNTTLSNGNLTATATAAGGGGVRSVHAVTAGKYYWEPTAATTSSGSTALGIANASANLATVGSAPSNACVCYQSGAVWLNNASQGFNIGSYTSGQLLCIALDVTGKLIWIRRGTAGNWNGSGTANPATGTGGLNIASISSASTLYAVFGFIAASQSCIANFGASAFGGTVPSGFTAGFPG